MDSIEARLADWGSWAGGFGRGGSSSSPVWEHLAKGAAQQAGWEHFPPEIEMTERAIAQLKIRSKYLKTLIFQAYLYRLTPEEIATNLDRSTADIERGLSNALDWIGDWIDSQEEISHNLQRLAISHR